eukprot:2169601-Prymnesium_polylepis.1
MQRCASRFESERRQGQLAVGNVPDLSRANGGSRHNRDGKPNSLADVEKLIKVYKSHRSAEVFDKKFCHA